MLTDSQLERRRQNAIFRKHWDFVHKVNDNLRRREKYREPYERECPDDPPESARGIYRRQWNTQRNDRKAFGHRSPFGVGPLQTVTWDDGRTLWDELHVLKFVFGVDAEVWTQ